MHKPNGSDILIQLTVAACIVSAVVTIISFFLYVRARLAFDRREERYRSIHFITLAIFTLLGVLLLIELSHRLNRPILTE
jgi:threonine/homoserine/homoserine lactone efflux protein